MESGTYLGANGSKEDTIIRGKITNARIVTAGADVDEQPAAKGKPQTTKIHPLFRFLVVLVLATVLVLIGLGWLAASRAEAGSVWIEDWAPLNQHSPPSTPTDKWNFHTYNIYPDPANPLAPPSTDSYSFTTTANPNPGGPPIPTLIMQGNAWGLESKQHFNQGAPIAVESIVKFDATDSSTGVSKRTPGMAGIAIYDGESGKYEEISLEDYLDSGDSMSPSNLRVWRRTEAQATTLPLPSTGNFVNVTRDHNHSFRLRLEYDGRGTWRFYAYDVDTGEGGLLYTATNRYQATAPNIFFLGVAFDSTGHEALGDPHIRFTASFQKVTAQANYNLFSGTSWVDFLSLVETTPSQAFQVDTNNGACPWASAGPPQCDYIQLSHQPTPNDASFAEYGYIDTPVISRTDPSNQTWGEVLFNTALNGGDVKLQVLDADGNVVSDLYLPGNSGGFRSSPIGLAWLDPILFPQIKLRAWLTRGPAPAYLSQSPQLLDWTLTFGKRSYFSWYDMQTPGMKDWLLMSNAAIYSTSSHFQTQLGVRGAGPSSYNVAAPGTSTMQTFPGSMNGPLMVNTLSGLPQVISQRVLLGDSLEETLSIPQDKISDKYFWTWYDMQTPGYKDWIVISNPDYASPVNYEIRMPGVDPNTTPGARGTIEPGGRATPLFPGVIGGPVVVQACSAAFAPDGSCSSPAKIMASQRVLMFDDTAFNEVNGTPASDLKDNYLWTWYDQQSPDAKNWVLVANPSAGGSVNYQISIAGGCNSGDASRCQYGTLQPMGDAEGRDRVTPTFPGVMGGPVEVRGCGAGFASDGSCSSPANVIASQRTLWDKSFEEVPGFADVSTPSPSLSSSYHWTWYDNYSTGSRNWVVVTNPNSESVAVQVLVNGVVRGTYGLAADGGMVTPSFGGLMGGPVEVRAYVTGGNYAMSGDRRPVLASQRVLWNNHINEVLGTVLDP
ncbi:MAG: hypothetical protein M1455_09530 [Actinobacteria bacterium]|nr:hypothetical protein [Actinomycetota bacterium]